MSGPTRGAGCGDHQTKAKRAGKTQHRAKSSPSNTTSVLLGAWREGSRDRARRHGATEPHLSLPSAHASLGASPTHLCLTLLTKTMKPRYTLHTEKLAFTQSFPEQNSGPFVTVFLASGQSISARLFSGVKATCCQQAGDWDPAGEGGPLSRLPRAVGLLVLSPGQVT